MENSILNQLYLFVIFAISGMIIGLFFDSFRVFRRVIKTSDFVTSIQDVVFWLLTGLFVLFIIFRFNNGEIRSYIFFGLALGTTLYILIISKYVLRVNIAILCNIKSILKKIITYLQKIPLFLKNKKDF